ncbi:MAG TPA: hypothetical protein VMF69_03765 [Gemmataceae bacterium]|nr:hypothetical protein [Gemmataceae bacterium]
MTVFDDWLSRKLSRPAWTIRQERTVEEKFSRICGPHMAFARIILTGEPGESFDFRSVVQWPAEPQRYDAAVVDGLLDELLATNLGPAIMKVRFVLREIGWHEVDSSPNAFYQAARIAVRKVIEGNIVYPWDRPRE